MSVRFDDPNLVSSAGLVPVLALPDSAALLTLADEQLSVPGDKRREHTVRDLDRYLHALLLDYGSGLNQPRDPTAVLRDYLVRTQSGLLLGQALIALGHLRLPVGYFVLEPL